MAVLKPRPNRTPTGYSCHSFVIRLIQRPKNRKEPAAGQLAFQLGLVVLAAAHRGEDPHDPGQDHQVQQPDQQQEGRRDHGAEQAQLLQPQPLSATAENTVFSATTMPIPIATTTVECPREKKNPNPNGRGWPAPAVRLSPCGWCCRSRRCGPRRTRAATQGVGQNAHPDPQSLVVGRHHEHQEDKKPEHVQAAITPYIASTLARSWRVIAANDCRTRRPRRGDTSAVAARHGFSLRQVLLWG